MGTSPTLLPPSLAAQTRVCSSGMVRIIFIKSLLDETNRRWRFYLIDGRCLYVEGGALHFERGSLHLEGRTSNLRGRSMIGSVVRKRALPACKVTENGQKHQNRSGKITPRPRTNHPNATLRQNAHKISTSPLQNVPPPICTHEQSPLRQLSSLHSQKTAKNVRSFLK